MQSLELKNGKLKTRIEVPPSKSYANRALILSAIKQNSPKLLNLPDATDVTFLLSALKAIGLIVIEDKASVQFTNFFPQCEKKSDVEIDVGEGGTTARFLACMLLLGRARYTLILGNRLKHRPWDDFITLARQLGAQADLNENRLIIQGPAAFPSELRIDCSRTTQFATGFQLISDVTKSHVIPVNMNSSLSYWRMTEKLVNEMKDVSSFSVPLDWSSASYPMAFAALNHMIMFPGLSQDDLQADSKFLTVLQKLGCIDIRPEGIQVSPVKTNEPIQIDVSDCLDLVPTLGYFLSHLEGEHELTGIANLIHKESDRLTEVIKLLNCFGRKAWTSDGKLFIQGDASRLQTKRTLLLPDDHRMVMTGTLFLLHHGGGVISPAEAVAKSYPDFFKTISA